jgi:fatty acid/phospholipid synthesis protein PlsX
MIKIAVDAYGGDNAPEEIVKGALLAVQNNPELGVVLTGKAEILEGLVGGAERVEIVNATEVITNDDVPTVAIKRKADSSMVRAFDAVKERSDVSGIVSAGSTGALLTGAFLKLGRIKGVSRPALAPLLPTVKGNGVVLCDCGANADCKAQNLLHFAYMAAAFYTLSTGSIEKPRIALLSNGTEDKKGNELTHEAFCLLKESDLNFVGNMEARDLLSGNYDVVVADGFSGNIALKSAEGTALTVFDLLKGNIANGGLRAKIGALMLKPALKRVKHKLDYSESGGAVFLGIEYVVVKIHGSAKAKSVAAGIQQAALLSKQDVIGEIKRAIGKTANGTENDG